MNMKERSTIYSALQSIRKMTSAENWAIWLVIQFDSDTYNIFDLYSEQENKIEIENNLFELRKRIKSNKKLLEIRNNANQCKQIERNTSRFFTAKIM